MKITEEKFSGSWELKEWIAQLEDGSIVFPFGKDAKGQIVYNSNGHMAVQIMKNNRPHFVYKDIVLY